MVTFFYELMYVFVTASALLSLLSNPLGLGKVSFLLFVLQLGITLLFVLFKNSSLTGRLVSIGILFSATIFTIILSRYEIFVGKAVENIKLLWLPAIGIAAFVIGELIAYVRVFGIIVSILSFASLIPTAILKWDVSKLLVASVFFLVLLTIANETQRRWKKYGNNDLKTHMVYIAPFLLLIAAVVFISPAPKTPYKWPIVKTVYKKAKSVIQDIKIKSSIRKNEDYAEAVMGFSDEGDINGEVKKNTERVLAVISIPPETERLRIAGKNFSTFTGRGWIDEDTDGAPDSMFDSIGLMASLYDYTEYPGDFVQWDDMYFEYIQMNTSYVFTPPKSAVRKSNFPIYNYEIRYSGSDVLWPESRSYKTSYNMTYLLANTENDDFVQFIEDGTTPGQENYEKALHQFGLRKDQEYTYDKFIAHQEYIKDFYGQEVVLSDELQSYMDELLKDCDSDYEKLVRIRAMLKTFEYSTTPGTIPEYVNNESEFLDYFILKERKGYCTFFASAFVLLARSEGLPARYVQGYSASTKGLKSMYITSDMAHAWAEVYFDGAGWIAFDATPGYDGGSYWKNSSKTFEIPVFGDYDPKDKPEATNPLPELPEIEEEESITLKWYMIAVPVVSGIAVIILFYILFRISAILRFKKLDYDKQFVIICRQIFAILKLLGMAIEDGETIQEYKRRLSKEYPEFEFVFLDDLEKYLYDTKKELKKGVTENAFKTRLTFINELKKKSLIKYIRYQLINF